jgi:hypothetical protein
VLRKKQTDGAHTLISLRCSISKIILLLIAVLFIPFASQATEQAEIFSISQPDTGTKGPDPHVSWTMEFVESGIKCSLEVSFEKPEEVSTLTGEAGWEYRVEVDGITVLQNFHTDTQKRVEQIIPLGSLNDGKHIAVLIVRDFEGKLHTQQIEFELNSSPIISATFLEDKAEVIDPQITLSFLGERDGFVGMVEIYLDEQPLKTVNISREQNKNPVSLSDLIGSQIYSADLTPGKHLLTIEAHGINGSSSVYVLSIAGSLLLPEIEVYHSADNKLERLEIYFPASSKKIVGSAEIHYNRSTILVVRTDKPILLISRGDLIDALEKHNLKIGDASATMIISTRSANQIENWQEVIFN